MVKVLDHGYVDFVEMWGSDERIIEAARMSTNKGFQGWGPIHPTTCLASASGAVDGDCTCHDPKPGDEKLLRYLWEHKHYTPFEMAGLTIEVQAPIFVFREWHRHRTLSAALDDDMGIDAYNELSSRYTPLPDLFYLPSDERMKAAKQDTKNKQGSVDGLIPEYDLLQGDILGHYQDSRRLYEELLSKGVAREIARLVIPVAQYSRMRASANLRNWLAFLDLRMHKAAQWEIQQFANAVGDLVAERFPRTWSLFLESRT